MHRSLTACTADIYVLLSLINSFGAIFVLESSYPFSIANEVENALAMLYNEIACFADRQGAKF